MKKNLLIAGFLIFSISTFAQTLSYGIKAGVNFSEITSSGSGASVSSQNLTGFHAGVIVDLGLGAFSLQPGLFYTTKGGKNTATETEFGFTGTGSSKTTLNYLELPVNLLYKIPAIDGKIFLGAGPYIGYGLSGRLTGTVNIPGVPATNIDQKITFGNDDGDIKNPDYGANFLLGYEFDQGLLVSANYQLGLASSPYSDFGKVKSRVLSISVGYLFK